LALRFCSLIPTPTINNSVNNQNTQIRVTVIAQVLQLLAYCQHHSIVHFMDSESEVYAGNYPQCLFCPTSRAFTRGANANTSTSTPQPVLTFTQHSLRLMQLQSCYLLCCLTSCGLPFQGLLAEASTTLFEHPCLRSVTQFSLHSARADAVLSPVCHYSQLHTVASRYIVSTFSLSFHPECALFAAQERQEQQSPQPALRGFPPRTSCTTHPKISKSQWN